MSTRKPKARHRALCYLIAAVAVIGLTAASPVSAQSSKKADATKGDKNTRSANKQSQAVQPNSIRLEYSDLLKGVVGTAGVQELTVLEARLNAALTKMACTNAAAAALLASTQTIYICDFSEHAATNAGLTGTGLLGGQAEMAGDFHQNGSPRPGGRAIMGVNGAWLRQNGWEGLPEMRIGGDTTTLLKVAMHELLHATSASRRHPPDPLSLYEDWVKEFERALRRADRERRRARRRSSNKRSAWVEPFDAKTEVAVCFGSETAEHSDWGEFDRDSVGVKVSYHPAGFLEDAHCNPPRTVNGILIPGDAVGTGRTRLSPTYFASAKLTSVDSNYESGDGFQLRVGAGSPVFSSGPCDVVTYADLAFTSESWDHGGDQSAVAINVGAFGTRPISVSHSVTPLDLRFGLETGFGSGDYKRADVLSPSVGVDWDAGWGKLGVDISGLSSPGLNIRVARNF